MTRRSSKSETEILLQRIPQLIARRIRARGDDAFRIRQKRTHGNRDNHMFWTNPILWELLARKDDVMSSEEVPINNPDNNLCDDSCGRAA